IAYEAEQLVEGRGSAEHHWRTLLDTAESLIEDGLRPSDPQLRRVLAPIAPGVPAGIEPGAQARLALREAQRTIAEGEEDAEEAPEDEPPPEVLREASALLRDRTAVIIGGEERPEAGEVLRKE